MRNCLVGQSRFLLIIALSAVAAIRNVSGFCSPAISKCPSLVRHWIHEPSRKLAQLHQSSQTDVKTEDVVVPEDAVIIIKPAAMERLAELKSKQDNPEKNLILRMGVRKGGCSGMSYVMDFAAEDDISEEDIVDNYEAYGVKCVTDPKAMLYLYGMELEYSSDLVGGGFKFYNPNAEKTCGCGSSFGL